MKIVGEGKERHIIYDCPWCGEIIDESEGDDKIAHEDSYYHYGCFEEMMEGQQ